MTNHFEVTVIRFLDWCFNGFTASDIAVLYFGLPLVFLACSAVHEFGHVVAGLLFGAPAVGVRVGMGPSLTLWRGARCPIEIGLLPFTGHVEFSYLPLSRKHRLAMYMSGPMATAIATVPLWLCIPSQAWLLRLVAVALFMASSIDNLCTTRPEGDGTAIWGLWLR